MDSIFLNFFLRKSTFLSFVQKIYNIYVFQIFMRQYFFDFRVSDKSPLFWGPLFWVWAVVIYDPMVYQKLFFCTFDLNNDRHSNFWWSGPYSRLFRVEKRLFEALKKFKTVSLGQKRPVKQPCRKTHLIFEITNRTRKPILSSVVFSCLPLIPENRIIEMYNKN